MASVSAGDITIVVPTRNRATTVFETLRYLRNDLHWENSIILVDQSDDHGDKLQELLETEHWKGITCFYQEERGSSVARNAGAKRVETDWIFFLGGDVMPKRLNLQTVADFPTK